ncbi:MAG: acyl carrier protein [Gammaproteobacteria bacterium CG_4_10_14_0_8_um_filter_38_16]|nr:MAG: acyl carrier protein [Gammaproteobacteria bacterium CG_4_10_14_0_8_um_filter_38_16]PJA04316.1 MAG: acyl carrier protein [Gammaproteobacteria bacterium CG_4_10_14_0_2_um_filter_38_22]PJB10070.1 MAG: acyl carrier protein [Gammaproteobacteria bacterium CG_4_9_14_3_um_filter_38_9]
MSLVVFEQVKKILVERFAINPTHVQLSADMQKDLNMDSMDALDLLLAVNEAFGIRIVENSLEKIHTIDDLVRCIEKNKK